MAKQPLNENDREQLVAYLDGELDEKSARALEARLHLDPNARHEADTLKRTWDLLDYLPRSEPSPNFTHRTVERLTAQNAAAAQRTGGRRRWLGRAAWAAAVLLAAAVGFSSTNLVMHRQRARLDSQLARELHLIENLRAYEHVDDLDFLHKLANPNDPDLFGDDNSDS